MLASLLHIGLKVRSKSSEFFKDCREQNFSIGLLCRFDVKRQCRLFLFRCHTQNIYKYAYLCNFSHKCEVFCGFARFFLVKLRVLCKFKHKMCRFLVYLGKISSVFELCLCNCIAIAFQLLCNCNANYASLSCLVLSCQLTSCLVISKNKYLWNTTSNKSISFFMFLSFFLLSNHSISY